MYIPILMKQRLRKYTSAYLFEDEFTTSKSAPFSGASLPTNPGPGTWKGTDSASNASVSAGEYTYAASVNAGDPLIASNQTYARINGRTVTLRGVSMVGSARGNGGWYSDQLGTGADCVETNTTAQVRDNGVSANSVVPTASGTTYDIWVMLRSTGAFFFLRTGGGSITLDWIGLFDTHTGLTVGFANVGAAAGQRLVDAVRVADMGLAVFATDFGICSVNVASPTNLAALTATADQIIDLTLTAPGTLATEGGFYYRDNGGTQQNCWHAYFNSAGAVRLDSIVAGVATNRISVAGAITNGATRTLRVRCNGSLHDLFTLNGTAWTKQGSQVNVSNQNTIATMDADIGAGWTASNFYGYPLTSTNYATLDSI